MTIGDKIAYPAQGPCLITCVVERAVSNESRRFYQLTVLSGGGNIFVPVEKLDVTGSRLLLKRAEIAGLLDYLKQGDKAPTDWKCRKDRNQKLLTSGTAHDLAEIVLCLTGVRATKNLSFAEQRLLDRAKMLLVCEVAEVMEMSRREAETEVERALHNPTLSVQ